MATRIVYSVEGCDNEFTLKDTSIMGLVSAIHAIYNGKQVTAPDLTSRIRTRLYS
jgi:hypothetical protein